jgi:hypothetical protein
MARARRLRFDHCDVLYRLRRRLWTRNSWADSDSHSGTDSDSHSGTDSDSHSGTDSDANTNAATQHAPGNLHHDRDGNGRDWIVVEYAGHAGGAVKCL